MALSRRSGSRFEANIWPGFVDAMTALLLVLMFVLTVFMIVQFALRETITTQGEEIRKQDEQLLALSGEVTALASALGLEQQESDTLEGELDQANAQAQAQATLIANLTSERDTAQTQIASFEEQVASLIAQNTNLDEELLASRNQVTDTEAELASTAADNAALQQAQAEELSRNEALQLALAQSRNEIDVSVEEARLAAARAEALEALAAELRSEVNDTETALAAAKIEADDALSDSEQARLAEAAAAEVLRSRLISSDAELTAMTLNLEEERKRAEETLTLLAAAQTAKDDLEREFSTVTQSRAQELSQAERQAALLAAANQSLIQEKEISIESQRQVALLNRQTSELRQQLNALQGLLDASAAADADAQIRIENLGTELNTALARAATEERARADLEERERIRLQAEAKNLESYRSEFFGRVREVLGDREGVRIVGDRFVFSSEVLFDLGSASLGEGGRDQLTRVAAVILEITDEIPDGLNWVLQVDGHTDNVPITGGVFADNWELSQARALSVVKYLSDFEGLPPDRLSANGFGEYQPVDPGDSPEALARNRRIELKFTER